MLSLTDAGAELLHALSESLDDMATAVEKVSRRSRASPKTLTLRSPPSFAARWLAPKLKSFRKKHPGIDLRIRHSNEPVDFSSDNIDLAVTYGDGSWPNVVAVPVLRLDFFPVCSPDYIKSDRPLDEPDNLRHYNLLHDATMENWEAWLSLAGLDDIDWNRGTILDDTNVLIQAAIDGQGVALGSSVFVSEHLQAARLLKPFDIVLEPELAYHLVCPEVHLQREAVTAFRDWALLQANR